jgi:PKD repeat protein
MYPDTLTQEITVINSSTGTNLTYLWDFGDGNTSTLQNPSYTYSTAGPFHLCLTVNDGAGCVDMYCDSIGENGVVFKTSGFTINVIGTPIITGLDNHSELNSGINVYPNPTSNQLTVDTELKLSKITIIDITGKMIMTTKGNTNTINVADLSDGIYFIQLITEEITITKKFVKQ